VTDNGIDNDKNQQQIAAIDDVLKHWQQGDCVLGEHWFVHRFNPQYPLTGISADLTDTDADLTESEVKGFAVITQTCDIIRSCGDRPYLELAPLVEVDAQKIQDIKRCRRPQYAYIAGIAEQYLVADLDRTMTVEKSVIIQWECHPGCLSDHDIRALGQALSRKRARFAFPDDFTEFVQKLKNRLQSKHDKHSTEGKALRALREIRVRAEPDWHSTNIRPYFWFIRHEEDIDFEGASWDTFLDQWESLIPAFGRFQAGEGEITTLEDMTAKEYIESDPLDLDHLSP
jgi:hypothetical protein